MILDEFSFSFVENDRYRYFCSVTYPLFDIPSCRTITKDVPELFAKEKIMLKSLFSVTGQRVSLTTDLWTSVYNQSYMVVTSHFIDSDWKLHRKILSFSPMSSHKGDDIG